MKAFTRHTATMATALCLAALLGGCGAAPAPTEAEPSPLVSSPPASSAPPAVSHRAPPGLGGASAPTVETGGFEAEGTPIYGSFEAAMAASGATVRAVAGETLATNTIACGPEGGTTTETSLTTFTVVEALAGELRAGQSFTLYQSTSWESGPAPSAGMPLLFHEGEQYVLCLNPSAEPGRYTLLSRAEGAYIPGDCPVGEEGYNFLPYTNDLGPVYVGEITEFEIVEAAPPVLAPQGPAQRVVVAGAEKAEEAEEEE